MFYPELDEKESIVWPFVKQLLQASFLLWEFVVDLPDVHRLQIGVQGRMRSVFWYWPSHLVAFPSFHCGGGKGTCWSSLIRRCISTLKYTFLYCFYSQSEVSVILATQNL